MADARQIAEQAADAKLLVMWRSVRGPHAELDGPLIRFAAKVRIDATAQAEKEIARLKAGEECHVARPGEGTIECRVERPCLACRARTAEAQLTDARRAVWGR